MPQFAMAIGSAALATWGPMGAAVGQFTLFQSFLIRAGIGIALNALTPKSSGLQGGTVITQRVAAAHHQIIYGRARVGGAVIFDHSKGEDNQYLHRVIVFAGHEIEEFEEIWFDDYKLTISSGTVTGATKTNGKTTDRFNGSKVYTKLGKANQSAFSSLMGATNKWTSDHRGRGRALMYVRLEYDEDGENFPTGIPNISAIIKGKKVYDPRTGLTEWSDNPALCWRDYLASRYGLGEEDPAIDDDSIIVAANDCDTLIDGEKRFTCNGSFYSNGLPGDTLFALAGSMGGLFWYSQGKWRLRAPTWTAPTVAFDENDLRGPITMSTRHSRRDNFNEVRGTFRGDETDWQMTDFPPVTNADFVTADGGQESAADVQLLFTGTSVEARRIARLMLEQNRQQVTFTAQFGLRAMRVQVGDFVNVSNTRFGWTDKAFEVNAWRLMFDDEKGLTVEMTLQETAESVFDEVNDGIVYERDNTDLPDPFDVPDVGIALSSTLREFREKVNNELSVTVTSSKGYDLDSVIVEYKSSASTTWIGAGTGELGTFVIPDLEDGAYDVRARGVNLLGVRGSWVEMSVTLDALSQAPADVTDFVAEVNGASINLSWTPVSDIDLSHYKIRFSPLLVGAEWSNSITYVDKISRPASNVSVPARAGTFMVRAVDKSGVQSENHTSVVVSAADLEQFTTTLTQTEHPTFAGTKNGCEVVSNELRIAAFDNFDSLTGNLDDLIGQWDDLGAQYVGTNATYDFSNYIDAGSVKRCRVRINAYTDRFDASGGLWDDLSGNIDGLSGLWDNLTQNPQFDDTNVVAYVSTTDDDPTGSPTWSSYRTLRVADISARAFRFRIGLLAGQSSTTPSIGQLEAFVDVTDTANAGDITGVIAGNGLTGGGASGSATLNVGAGTGVTVAADTVSIGQAVAATDDVTFAGLTIQKTGETTATIKATSSGAGNDDDATLILDAAETGEALLEFRQDGVAKASIDYFSAGNPDLNIRTESGTNGVIDFQPNNSLAMRVSDGEVIVYDELDPRGGITSHYDSGWTSVSNNNYYDFTHNLGLTGDQMLVMVFVRDASNRIFQIPAGYSNSTSREVGPSISHKSTNVVQIATGNDGIYAYDNTELSGSVTLLTSGEYRVKIMKWM